MTRRNIHFPDDLWGRIQRAALDAGVERGEAVPISEWIRQACRERLAMEARGVAPRSASGPV